VSEAVNLPLIFVLSKGLVILMIEIGYVVIVKILMILLTGNLIMRMVTPTSLQKPFNTLLVEQQG